ncbi:DUF1214 domain-containing protein [Phenylobacterium sp. LjRoot219]|uniref:DUF1214 domain-containing protein n=1 Tax=Phenylobacterium sp. LjRoot219 TaxID=3342283 RepID=UPI003ECE7114
MAEQIAPNILDYLKDGLEEAVAELANTWRPDDPEYRADVYRQIMMQLSYGYFAFFHADPEHPDWAPLWNPVYTLQPNPDDIYLYCPISSDYQYRIVGNRGTIKMLTMNTQAALSGMPGHIDHTGEFYADLDDGDLQIDANGDFEVLLSTERPAGHTGNWLQIKPGAVSLMTRYRSYDWGNEIEPVMSIECLNPTGLKKRLSPEEILERIDHMARMPVRCTKLFYGMQNAVKASVGVNVFEPVRYGGALSRQVYLPAVFEFEDDEALILETELPEVRRYWNFQLNDPYFNAIEFVYRLSSTNGHFAKASPDGKFRAVISLKDPGVPNWLDPAGFKQGTIYGRWYDCDSTPTPTLKRVKFAELRQHLPADTPVVTPEDRDAELRARVRAAQRRRRW